MSLVEKISADIKTAMLAKDKETLESLRSVKAALLLAQTSGDEVTEEIEIKLLQKLVKQRKESAIIYTEQNRQELADKELSEAAIIEKYLPAQIGDAELGEIIKKIISETGASSIKDMGKVVAAANKELSGRAEGKIIAEKVKALLA